MTNSVPVGKYNEVKPIENATVKIFDKNSNFIETLVYNPTSFESYISTRGTIGNTKIGETYKIEVSAPNYETVYSESYIPQPVNIISMDTVGVSLPDGEKSKKVTVHFMDDCNKKNYYGIKMTSSRYKIKLNIGGVLDTIRLYKSDARLTTLDGGFEEPYTNTHALYFNDDNFNGTTHSFSFIYKLDTLSPSANKDLFLNSFTFYTFSEDVFKFRSSLNRYNRNSENPFSQPVKIYSNIKNGLGIFGGFSYRYADFYSNTQ